MIRWADLTPFERYMLTAAHRAGLHEARPEDYPQCRYCEAARSGTGGEAR